MREISRREFIKLAGKSFLGLSLPNRSLEATEHEVEPLTDLPIIYTENTPIRITYLDYRGKPLPAHQPEWRILSGVPVDILTPITPISAIELGVQPQEDSPTVWVAKLPHVTGSPFEITAVVGSGEARLINNFNGKIQNKGQEVISTYAYSEQPYIYANKIWNDLTALAAISSWQKQHGPLMPGEEFSYFKTTNVIERVYEDYMQSSVYWAGGICATSTAISKAVFLAGAKGYTEELRRTRHLPHLEYWASPLDPGITKANSDASVLFRLDSEIDDRRNVDYRSRVREGSIPVYFSFNAHLDYDKEPNKSDYYPPADARFTFTVTLQKEAPQENQEEALLALREEYAGFHQYKS